MARYACGSRSITLDSTYMSPSIEKVRVLEVSDGYRSIFRTHGERQDEFVLALAMSVGIQCSEGREQEIADVKRLLATTRLLTLTGVGSSGKTRLALGVGAGLTGTFPDGIWFAELSPLPDPSFIPQAVAVALGLRERLSRPLTSTLVDYLRDKQLLLLLDNCEHLLDACARFADVLRNATPKLTILASSRQALGIGGEQAYAVPSLALPDCKEPIAIAELARYDAVRLFVERVKAVQPHFQLRDVNASAVAHTCRRLDGIPLAIELAAIKAAQDLKLL
jgi:predicted ATPase